MVDILSNETELTFIDKLLLYGYNSMHALIGCWAGIINYLITESEVVTGKSQTEALPNGRGY